MGVCVDVMVVAVFLGGSVGLGIDVGGRLGGGWVDVGVVVVWKCTWMVAWKGC